MISEVLDAFGIVPLEIVIPHDTAVYPSVVKNSNEALPQTDEACGGCSWFVSFLVGLRQGLVKLEGFSRARGNSGLWLDGLLSYEVAPIDGT